MEEVESIIYKIINKIELINHDGTNNENIENIDSGDGAPKKRKLSMYLVCDYFHFKIIFESILLTEREQ